MFISSLPCASAVALVALAAGASAQGSGSGEADACACFSTAWPGAFTPPPECQAVFASACEAGTLPPALSPLCGPQPEAGDEMAAMGLLFAQIGFMEPSSAACGAPYLRMSVFMSVASQHPLYWTTEMTSTWVFFYGVQYMDVDPRSSAHPAKAFWDNDVDGRIFMSATSSDLRAIGFSMGSALRFVEKRNNWLQSYGWPPSDALDPEDATLTKRLVGDPFNVSLAFVLERINGVDEEAFSFEVEMLIILSWEDNKIFSRCENAGVGGFAPSDPCGLFWQPTLLWPNAILDPHPQAELSPSIIEDFGLTTVVGRDAAANSGSGDPPSKVVNSSVGFRMFRVRGTFMASLDFRGFPYDWQQLNVTVQMPFTLPRRKARLLSRSEPQPTLGADAGTPIWEVMCVTASEGVLDYTNFGEVIFNSKDDPFANWYRAASTLPPSEMVAELKPGTNADEMTPESQRWSTATMTIHTRRIYNFYNLNFVLVVALLVFASFASLIIQPSALDSRLGLTLTVVLGLNVFQIVVIDNTPETGYLTNMHAYCLLCTVLVILVAVENVAAFWADLRETRLKALEVALRRVAGQAESRRLTVQVQSSIRAFLARKRVNLIKEDAQIRSLGGATGPQDQPTNRVLPFDSSSVTKAEESSSAAVAVQRTRQTRVLRGFKLRFRVGCSPSMARITSKRLDIIAIWASRNLDALSAILFPLSFALIYTFALSWSPPNAHAMPELALCHPPPIQ